MGITAFFCPLITLSQSRDLPNIHFNHLTTAQGLSDNYINSLALDKSGNLWIATGEGLNMYNGRQVSRFFHRDYPQLRNDFMRQVLCDEQDRIWVMTGGAQLTLIDENRRFHKVTLYDNGNFLRVRWMLPTREHGIVLFTPAGFFSLADKDRIPSDSLSLAHFSRIEIAGFDTLQARPFVQVEPFDADNHVLSLEDGFFKIDFREKRIGKKFHFPGRTILGTWKTGELLVFNKSKNQVEMINLETEKVTLPLSGIRDQNGKTPSAVFTRALFIHDDQVVLTTKKEGIYIFDAGSRHLHHYRHNAADPYSLINNTPYEMAAAANGWVFLGATPNGISYFKSDAVIGQQVLFMDQKGNSYNGAITTITSRDNDTYYIGVEDNLLEWKRSTNSTRFVDYAAATGKSLMNREGVSSLCFDPLDRLWVATALQGIFVLDKKGKLLKHLKYEENREQHTIPRGLIRHMKMQADGFMWVAGNTGIARVDIRTFESDRFANHPLAAMKGILCFYTFLSDTGNIWIGTGGRGLWHYKSSTKELVNHSTKNGLISNDVYCVNKDRDNNIYIGTPEGLQIFLHNGGTRVITEKEGLLSKRVEALLLDKRNRMWMGNDLGLSCFNIADSSLRVFDERYGLSIQGFRIGSYHQNSDDELVWGTERGIQYFYPDKLLAQKISLVSVINRVETRNAVHNLTKSIHLDLPANDNAVNFYFSSIEYSTTLRTFYQYRLEGEDEDWISIADQNSVRYSSLAPGNYTFRVRASNDNKDWVEAANAVTLRIAKPVWMQSWFKALGLVLVMALIWFVINYYRKKQRRQQEELETEHVISYFASSIYSQQKEEDILWDVARNCISRLNFEDCVIYLLDEERKVLVQKAAWGPKMKRDFTIHQPIEIPVGTGIVGSVAATGRPELIGNTDLDPRYVADDARRYSELAVPIVIDDKVIGVIDSEHTKKNFFTPRHLNILSAVAVLSAHQIQRAKAEEEKQKARIEALETKQKVTESRLQSLRLQMNPHFLFNALNSIQQMILANEEMVATRYLSRFSKLLRMILVHSDKELVTLNEELEILNLYVELEAIRFKDSFHYSIICDEAIDRDEVKLPTLLVQPFVENAIWHGLMHKEEDRRLEIRFFEKGDYLHCIIQDNGIGRRRAGEVKIATGKGKQHASKGISVSLERLRTLANGKSSEEMLTILDMEDEKGQACGTRVEIRLPILN